ncbi:MAG: hypothetical protein R3C11_26870 [Planctomycetaceae bacterium]
MADRIVRILAGGAMYHNPSMGSGGNKQQHHAEHGMAAHDVGEKSNP